MSLPADFNESVATIIRTEGIKLLTLKDLRRRLEAKYQMSLEAHQQEVQDAATAAMQLPDIQKELAKAKQERDAGPIGGKGKKRVAAQKAATKTVKQKKPDNYPKAPLGSYIIFANDHRDDVKARNPTFKNTEIMKAIGELWSSTSDSEKAKYKKKAEEDKVRFEKEMEAFKSAGGEEVSRSGKVVKAKSDGPKRGKNAYMFFSSDFRLKNPGNVVEVSKAAGVAWDKLDAAQRKPYEEMAAKDKERYQRELAELQ